MDSVKHVVGAAKTAWTLGLGALAFAGGVAGSVTGAARWAFTSQTVEDKYPHLYAIASRLTLEGPVPDFDRWSNGPESGNGLFGTGDGVTPQSVSRYPSLQMPKALKAEFRKLTSSDRALVKGMVIRREIAQRDRDMVETWKGFDARSNAYLEKELPQLPTGGAGLKITGPWSFMLALLSFQAGLKSLAPSEARPSVGDASATSALGLRPQLSFGSSSPTFVEPFLAPFPSVKALPMVVAKHVQRRDVSPHVQRRDVSPQVQAARSAVTGAGATAFEAVSTRDAGADSRLGQAVAPVQALDAAGHNADVRAAAVAVAPSVATADGELGSYFSDLGSAVSGFTNSSLTSVNQTKAAYDAAIQGISGQIQAASTVVDVNALELSLQAQCEALAADVPDLDVSALIASGDVNTALSGVCSALSARHSALSSSSSGQALLSQAVVDGLLGNCDPMPTAACQYEADVAAFAQPCATGASPGGLTSLQADFQGGDVAGHYPHDMGNALGGMFTSVNDTLRDFGVTLSDDCLARLSNFADQQRQALQPSASPSTAPPASSPVATPSASVPVASPTPSASVPVASPSASPSATPSAACSAQVRVVGGHVQAGAPLFCEGTQLKLAPTPLEGGEAEVDSVNRPNVPQGQVALSGATVSGNVIRQAVGTGVIAGGVVTGGTVLINGESCDAVAVAVDGIGVAQADVSETVCGEQNTDAGGGGANAGLIGGIAAAAALLALIALYFGCRAKRRTAKVNGQGRTGDVVAMVSNAAYRRESAATPAAPVEPVNAQGDRLYGGQDAEVPVAGDDYEEPVSLASQGLNTFGDALYGATVPVSDRRASSGGYLQIGAVEVSADIKTAQLMSEQAHNYSDRFASRRKAILAEAVVKITTPDEVVSVMKTGGNANLRLFQPSGGATVKGITAQLLSHINDTYYSHVAPETPDELDGSQIYAQAASETAMRESVGATIYVLVLPLNEEEVGDLGWGWLTLQAAAAKASEQQGEVLIYVPCALLRSETTTDGGANDGAMVGSEEIAYMVPVAGPQLYAEPKPGSQAFGADYQLFLSPSDEEYAEPRAVGLVSSRHPAVLGSISQAGIPVAIKERFADAAQPKEGEFTSLNMSPDQHDKVRFLKEQFAGGVVLAEQLVLVMPQPSPDSEYYSQLAQGHQLTAGYGWQSIRDAAATFRNEEGAVLLFIPKALAK
ncbi:MAG: hypothetical protein O3A01_03885 [bacterium]|nr:hypothetical protein [bacterium]